MGIELREVMEIFPFSEAKLLAGHAGKARQVLSANIQEVPSVDRWLKGGEILFTAGYAFRSAERGCEMMERLNELGIAALAIKPGQYLEEIPQEMIHCANRLGLPLFELPADLPYMDCIQAIFERVTQEQLLVMRRVEKVHAMLTETILNKKGLDGICSILNRLSGNPVFITGPGGHILACRVNENSLLPEAEAAYVAHMKEMLEDYFFSTRGGRLKHNQCNPVSPQSGVNLMVAPVCVQEEHIAYLVMDTAANAMMDMDMVAFAQAASMVAVEILNEQALWQREQKVREQLLEDLAMKRYSDEKLMIQRGLHLGIDLTGKYCLFVIDADSFEEVLKSGLLGVDEAKVQKIKNQVQHTIREAFRDFPRPSLVLDSSMGAMGLIEVRQDDDVEACIERLDTVVQELGKLNVNLHFSAGIGRVKEGIAHAPQGYREAQMAMRAGRGISHGEDKPIITHSFAQLGCLCFLCELSDSTAMRDFYDENMQALLEYDKDNGGELVRTLECFFASGQNLRKAAEMMFVHKNSVVYRLGKAEALWGRQFSDPRAAFDMQLCLKLHALIWTDKP